MLMNWGHEPVTEPPPNEIALLIEKVEQRAFSTYKARLQAHIRLSRLNAGWNSSLIALSTATTIASVGLLVDGTMYGKNGEVLMVALAILSLVASLIVASVNFGNRAKTMEANYKEVQQIAVKAEALKICTGPDLWSDYQSLQREYGTAVNYSENHSEGDHRRMRARASNGRVPLWDKLAMNVPFLTLLAPVGLLVPFVAWFSR